MQCVDFLHYMQFSRPCQCLFTRYSQKKGCFLMPFSPEIASFSPVSHMLLCSFLVLFGFVLDTEIIKNTNRFAVSEKEACKKGKRGGIEVGTLASLWGLSSVSLAADSSFCGRSLSFCGLMRGCACSARGALPNSRAYPQSASRLTAPSAEGAFSLGGLMRGRGLLC